MKIKKSYTVLFSALLALIITAMVEAPHGSRPVTTDRGSASSSLQTFNDGKYSFIVPADWRMERTGADAIAVHDTQGCKIEIFAFPFLSGGDTGGWIAQHIGADPSLKVTERSSEDVAIAGGSAVRWDGAIDGASTTLLYAFSADHAYEIAPSGGPSCPDALEMLMNHFSLQ